MNAVEIEEAVSELAAAPFDAAEFAYDFLAAFGNKDTTVKRLRTGASNGSDVASAVLQRNNIHIATCAPGRVNATLATLRTSPATAKAKAKFILATDGDTLEAEELGSGDTIACDYAKFADHFGFFLPLAGISTVKAIKNNPIDIKATSRLNKLYVELLKDNEDWAGAARRHDFNQFFARLIFCFFAEDTGIFIGDNLFTATIEQMSDSQSGNTQTVLETLFRAMDTRSADRAGKNLPRWADVFPFVNGGLFAGATDCPKFSRIARSYLLRAGELNWKEINPDIFGSMIQAVANEDERGELGLHYTSVPNILKVLNPLFLDDLREQFSRAEDNVRKLKNLRRRIAGIRVFDPACGSGNFLVIAYIFMRDIEASIIGRLGEANQRSWIKLENFFGIEIKDFAVEVARLALLIAEFQCDVRFIGQQEARMLVLPLKRTGTIVCGNALRLDWFSVCPPASKAEIVEEWDLGGPTGRLALGDEGLGVREEAETYICGNPPYKGSTWQTSEQKADLKGVFDGRTDLWKSLDYVAGWFLKAADYGVVTKTASAFVSTNSICQGQQVPILWPLIFATGAEIFFAHTSFKWANLASHNAGVTVVVVGISNRTGKARHVFSDNMNGKIIARETDNINAYLAPAKNVLVLPWGQPLSELSPMDFGSKPVDDGWLSLDASEVSILITQHNVETRFIRPYYGSSEAIRGLVRYCIWVKSEDQPAAMLNLELRSRFSKIAEFRGLSTKARTRVGAAWPFRFDEVRQLGNEDILIIPSVSSESREYLPVAPLPRGSIVSNAAFALYDAPLWNLALIASRIHLVWIATVCGKLKTDFRYSNTLGWNTFPVPTLTEKNKTDLNRCAEHILLAREAHFPATIADLYDPQTMPANLRAAHEANDETLERIYIGRRFKNDTERLEKLFEMYVKMTAKAELGKKTARILTRRTTAKKGASVELQSFASETQK